MDESDLVDIEARLSAASPGPWKAYVEGRDHVAGDTFIMIGAGRARGEDMYVTGGGPLRDGPVGWASNQDLDFIAEARQDIPRLLAEVRNLRAQLQGE